MDLQERVKEKIKADKTIQDKYQQHAMQFKKVVARYQQKPEGIKGQIVMDKKKKSYEVLDTDLKVLIDNILEESQFQ